MVFFDRNIQVLTGNYNVERRDRSQANDTEAKQAKRKHKRRLTSWWPFGFLYQWVEEIEFEE